MNGTYEIHARDLISVNKDKTYVCEIVCVNWNYQSRWKTCNYNCQFELQTRLFEAHQNVNWTAYASIYSVKITAHSLHSNRRIRKEMKTTALFIKFISASWHFTSVMIRFDGLFVAKFNGWTRTVWFAAKAKKIQMLEDLITNCD